MDRGGNDSEQMCKMFLGGLSFGTTENSVREYFEKYGEIVDCCVVTDKDGERKPRGFGFVTFAKSSCVDEVMAAKKEKDHVIDGRKVDAKRALPKGEGGSKESVNKAFVGGLAPETTVDDLRTFFSKHGVVTDVSIPSSSEGKRRKIAFVTFEDTDSVDKLIIMGNHELAGRTLNVSKAENKGRGGFSGQGNRGGRDFGGGGYGGRGGRGGGGGGGRGGRGGFRSGGGDSGYGGSRYGGGGGGGGGYQGGQGGGYGGGQGGYGGGQGGYGGGQGGYGGGQGGYSGGGGGGYGNNSGGGYSDFGSGYGQQSSGGPMRSGGGGGGYGGRNAPYSGGYGGNTGGGYGGGGNYNSGGNQGYGGGGGGGYGGGYNNSGGRNY